MRVALQKSMVGIIIFAGWSGAPGSNKCLLRLRSAGQQTGLKWDNLPQPADSRIINVKCNKTTIIFPPVLTTFAARI